MKSIWEAGSSRCIWQCPSSYDGMWNLSVPTGLELPVPVSLSAIDTMRTCWKTVFTATPRTCS